MNRKSATRPAALPALDDCLQDIRFALRALRATPGFSVIAIAILAIGIGANASVFSLLNAVMLRPLPFPEAERLVMVWNDLTSRGASPRTEPTLAQFADWREAGGSFDELVAWLSVDYNLTGDGEPARLSGVRTTPNLFAALGLEPVLGRTFTPDDEGPNALPVVVVSTTLWRDRYGADTGLVGRTITLDGVPRTVVGIVPPEFRYPNPETSVWVPAQFTPEELAQRGNFSYYVLGRLSPGVSIAEAEARLTSISRAVEAATDGGDSSIRIEVAELSDQLFFRDRTRPTVYMLLASVAALLLITCANLANLLLARGAMRQRELAVRKALGAGTGRILRQLLTECAVLGTAGLVAGIVLATLSFEYLARLVPAVAPSGVQPDFDWRVLVFTAALTFCTVALFGAGPAMLAARTDSVAALKSRASTLSAGGVRLRNAIIVAEISITVVLLIAAGLLVRSYAAVLDVDYGFRTDNLLIAETVLSPNQYAELSARSDFYRRVLERVREMPGIAAAGYVNYAPLTFSGGRVYLRVEGQPPPRPEEMQRQIISDRIVTLGYLETLEVPLLRGRWLDARDAADAPLVAMINEAMAQQLLPGEDPVGRRFRLGGEGADTPWITIVGVVDTIRQMGLDVPAEAELYLPADQVDATFAFFWPRHLVMRTQGDPLALAASVRQAIWAADASQPVSSIRTLDELVDSGLTRRDTQLTLLGLFAVLATVLSAIGLYGVLAYAVNQRSGEIALRMALGAPMLTVVRGIVSSALLLVATGIAIGFAVAFAGMRVLESFLFEVSTADPTTFLSVVFVLLLVALAASSFPALRAAWVDPAAALRSD